MKCTGCKKGSVLVHADYEVRDTYSQARTGLWKKKSTQLVGYINLYAECKECSKQYGVNEYKFYHGSEIEIFELEDIQVEVQTTVNGQNPSVVVYVDDKAIFDLIESLGYEIDPVMANVPPIPGEFEKHYLSPKGKGLFGGLSKEESGELIEKTEKTLSDNGVVYTTRVLTLADML